MTDERKWNLKSNDLVMHKFSMLFVRFIFVLLFALQMGCSQESQFSQSTVSDSEPKSTSPLESENLVAWCVVPYDNQNRGPHQRIVMLKKLGFSRYAYDWRERHLDSFQLEIQEAAKQGVEIVAVWIWIDARYDQPGKLSSSNERILQTIASEGLATEIWVGFHSNNFSGMPEKKKLDVSIQMTDYLSRRARESGSRVSLYNHGGWLGIPSNQVKVIEQLPKCDIGIVFNFHHAADECLGKFDEVIDVMIPYLKHVNLNGIHVGGPKISPIGSGGQEKQMIQKLLDAGYTGAFGILGHVEDRDVEDVLKENLEGLGRIKAELETESP